MRKMKNITKENPAICTSIQDFNSCDAALHDRAQTSKWVFTETRDGTLKGCVSVNVVVVPRVRIKTYYKK